MVGGPHDWHFPGTWGTRDFLPNSFGAEFILFVKTRFYGSGHSPPFHGGAPAYYIYISYFGAVWWSNDPGGWEVQWVTLVQFWIGENLACWSNLISLPWHYLYFALNWGFSFWCQIIHESILSWGWNNWNKRSFFLNECFIQKLLTLDNNYAAYMRICLWSTSLYWCGRLTACGSPSVNCKGRNYTRFRDTISAFTESACYGIPCRRLYCDGKY